MATIVGSIDPAVIQQRMAHKAALSKKANERADAKRREKEKEHAEAKRLQQVMKENEEGYKAPNTAIAAAFQMLDPAAQKAIEKVAKTGTGKQNRLAALKKANEERSAKAKQKKEQAVQ